MVHMADLCTIPMSSICMPSQLPLQRGQSALQASHRQAIPAHRLFDRAFDGLRRRAGASAASSKLPWVGITTRSPRLIA